MNEEEKDIFITPQEKMAYLYAKRTESMAKNNADATSNVLKIAIISLLCCVISLICVIVIAFQSYHLMNILSSFDEISIEQIEEEIIEDEINQSIDGGSHNNTQNIKIGD